MTPENKSELLPKYQPKNRVKDMDFLLKDKSKIIDLVDPEQITGLATPERVIGRKILEWSSSCGTYGQGGPGFFGLKLEAKNQIPEEWLILTLWSAGEWLELDGKWVEAHPNQYHIQEPLYSNFAELKKDEVTPLLKDKILKKFEVNNKSAILEIGDAVLKIQEDPNKRPLTGGTYELTELDTDEDLRNAWIISPVPWVRI